MAPAGTATDRGPTSSVRVVPGTPPPGACAVADEPTSATRTTSPRII
jgi:hypothetical protein